MGFRNTDIPHTWRVAWGKSQTWWTPSRHVLKWWILIVVIMEWTFISCCIHYNLPSVEVSFVKCSWAVFGAIVFKCLLSMQQVTATAWENWSTLDFLLMNILLIDIKNACNVLSLEFIYITSFEEQFWDYINFSWCGSVEISDLPKVTPLPQWELNPRPCVQEANALPTVPQWLHSNVFKRYYAIIKTNVQ